MSLQKKLFQVFIAFFMLVGLLTPAVMPVEPTQAKVQPQLAELAAQAPEQLVRVIVQKADSTGRAESLVQRWGGQVLKELHIINAFSAEMPARYVPKLAELAAVNWVSLDAPMLPAVSVQTVRDEFNSVSFSGNDGTVSWDSDWIEDDVFGAGPAAGNVDVFNGALRLDDSPDTGTSPSAARKVDLSAGVTAAVLSFDFQTGPGVDAYGDKIAIEVSADGGGTYSVLAILDDLSGWASGSRSYDITPYLSAETMIRFRVYDKYGGWDEYFLIDNVQIEFSVESPLSGQANATVRDEFNSVSFSGNDSTIRWAGDWIEDDVRGGGPAAGNVDIFYGALRLDDYPDTGTSPSAARKVDLSAGVTNAVLSFDFRTSPGVDVYEDKIAIEVSADGGGSYSVLAILDDLHGWASGSRSYDITPYISADTMIRFRIYDKYGGSDEHFMVDNVQIEIGMPQNSFPGTLGLSQLHAEGITGEGVTVAVIDSGIGKHPDLAERMVVAPEYGVGDLYGHGTHVTGIIGGDGSASGEVYTGVAPGANVISLGVSDEFGMAYESDVVYALQWVNDFGDQYNIRVVNLSLNSVVEDSYHNSGIDAAVEILWLKGVVVVASVGNKGPAGGHNTAKTAPANDPFIIVVGASNEHDTGQLSDDTIAPFSSHGITVDGFSRPDIIAPGYDIYSALSPDSTWDDDYPHRLGFQGEYFRLSGTSMAAPMVTGAVALLLQDEPNLTPDQVKYRLMHSGEVLYDEEDGVAYPYLNVYAAVHGTTTESAYAGFMPHMLLAKMALIAYWASQDDGAEVDWENVDWEAVNWDSVNWNSVNWNSVNWNSVNWNSVNWNSVNWNSVNWNSVNWNSVNWNSVNWNSVNWNSVNWNEVQMDGVFWGPDKAPKPKKDKDK